MGGVEMFLFCYSFFKKFLLKLASRITESYQIISPQNTVLTKIPFYPMINQERSA